MRSQLAWSIALASILAAVPSSSALPTPGLFCDLSEPATGRVFPEAMETNDYVGYEEALCGLNKLLTAYPDRMKLDVVTQSVGWDTITGGHDTFDVFVVRVSDYTSNVTVEDKIRLVFQLSIHGNEKGGREGGLRVIEDMVRGDMGFTAAYPEILDYMTYMEVLFVFPQPDGWTHEEAEYRMGCANYLGAVPRPDGGCVDSQNFVRTNGHGKDVNRQWPTIGWVQEAYEPMSEPEAQGLVAYLKNETNVRFASDIHGMLNPADGSPAGIDCVPGGIPPDVMGFDPTCFGSAVGGSKGHYVLTMLPAGRQDIREMTANTQLAELVKERLNSNPFYAEWNAMPNSMGGAWGGEFNDWGTVWDTIGYTDSGFTSDWYAQDHGLNAAGVDFELSYNHVTFDNYYPALAQRMNAYHVEIVRDIVRAFMDQAALDLEATVDVKGTKTAYVSNPTVLTNADNMSVSGWALENPGDDAWDIAHRAYRAAPNDYFADLQGFVADGDQPGVLDALQASDVTAARLAAYDNLVIPGSAYKTLDAAAVAAIRAWVEAGGNLVVTDEAMRIMADLGLVEADAIDVQMSYAGATNFIDRDHELAQGIRGLARETYEPVPVGFSIDALSAPVWYVDAGDFTGEAVGVAGQGQGSSPVPDMVNYGRIGLGAGKVSFLGALLPDPVNDGKAFYGVDSYATTYTGNQLLRNMLGWDVVFAETPVSPAELGSSAAIEEGSAGVSGETAAAVPAPGAIALLGMLGLLAVAIRRRK